MKKLILVFLTLALAAAASARDLGKGYRGFVDFGMTAGPMDYWPSDGGEPDDNVCMWEISTAHGFQINRHVFMGAGLMIGLEPMAEGMLPLYADFRYDFDFGRFTPFFDVRLGNDFCGPDYKRLYFAPTVGYRFLPRRKVGLNLGVGMTLLSDSGQTAPLFSVRVGFEF